MQDQMWNMPSDDYDQHESRSTETILVVEDSPTQAAQIRALLVANGLHVQVAQDGMEGIEKAVEIHPSLIILDLEMPRMNGVEAARALKAEPLTKSIPLILFTRHDFSQARALGLDEGMVDFIPKDAFAKVVMIETLKQMGIIHPTVK